jgi:hypothetical protein
LNEALTLLSQLEPETSHDPETLGLAAAIHKRLWSLTEDVAHLDLAVRATDRRFSLRDDYYNGINLACLLSTRAARGQIPAEVVADIVLAERVRRTVVELCDRWLEANTPSAQNAEPRYWVLATRAEALVGLGDASATRSLDAAYAAAPAAWMADSTKQQIAALLALLRDSPLKHLEPTPGAVSLDTRNTGGSLGLSGTAGPAATSAPQIVSTTVPPPPPNVAPPAASRVNVRRALCVVSTPTRAQIGSPARSCQTCIPANVSRRSRRSPHVLRRNEPVGSLSHCWRWDWQHPLPRHRTALMSPGVSRSRWTAFGD